MSNHELRTFKIKLIKTTDHGIPIIVDEGKSVSIDPWSAVKNFCEHHIWKNAQNHPFEEDCDYSISIEYVLPKKKKDKSGTRTCLSCEKSFHSTGPGNRRCPACIKKSGISYGKLSPRVERYTNSRKKLD